MAIESPGGSATEFGTTPEIGCMKSGETAFGTPAANGYTNFEAATVSTTRLEIGCTSSEATGYTTRPATGWDMKADACASNEIDWLQSK